MPTRLEKPWIPWTEANLAAVPGHLGVYQLGNAEGDVVFIGFAGGNSLFGLRGELAGVSIPTATQFRFEVNTAYLTRYRELMMVHIADFGGLPEGNRQEDAVGLGRLSP